MSLTFFVTRMGAYGPFGLQEVYCLCEGVGLPKPCKEENGLGPEDA